MTYARNPLFARSSCTTMRRSVKLNASLPSGQRCRTPTMSSWNAYPSTRIAASVDVGPFFFLYFPAVMKLEDWPFCLHCIVEGELSVVFVLSVGVAVLSSVLLGGMFSLLLFEAVVAVVQLRVLFFTFLAVVFAAVTPFFLGILCTV